MVVIVIVVVIFVEFVLWEVPIAVGRQELVQLHPLQSITITVRWIKWGTQRILRSLELKLYWVARA
jgi:hypothetical protein